MRSHNGSSYPNSSNCDRFRQKSLAQWILQPMNASPTCVLVVGVSVLITRVYPSRQAAFPPNTQDFCWSAPPSRCLDAIASGGNPLWRRCIASVRAECPLYSYSARRFSNAKKNAEVIISIYFCLNPFKTLD